MKVLFSNALPFFLAHGGTQTLLENLMRELSGLGVRVEPERWWDEKQTGDILHYMNRPPLENLRLAKQKGFKVVMTENLDQTASRSSFQLFAQRLLINTARNILPRGLTARLSWDVYQGLDAAVYVVKHEWETAQYLFNAPPEIGHIIPHGLEDAAITGLALSQPEGDYLISAATIHPRKNSVLLATAARAAKVPMVFLGKPYAEDDAYFLEFKNLMDGTLLRYLGFVSAEEKYQYLRGARGFVSLSQFESGSISIYEAAAAGLPLLLTDLPWARRVYHEARGTRFVGLESGEKVAEALRLFYLDAHRQPGVTFPLLSWRDVACQYVKIYEGILGVK